MTQCAIAPPGPVPPGFTPPVQAVPAPSPDRRIRLVIAGLAVLLVTALIGLGMWAWLPMRNTPAKDVGRNEADLRSGAGVTSGQPPTLTTDLPART